MAPFLTPPTQNRQDLLELEDRLFDDRHGFLLSLLPRELFVLLNDSIVLNPQYSPRHDAAKDSSIFAFFDDDRQLQLKALTSRDPEDRGRFASRDGETVPLNTLDDLITTFNDVPPLSWIERPPDWYGSQAWKEQSVALINYFLLLWAHSTGFTGWLPPPNYEHLSDLFRILKQTSHYKNGKIRREDDDVLDEQMSVYGSEDLLTAECTEATEDHGERVAVLIDAEDSDAMAEQRSASGSEELRADGSEAEARRELMGTPFSDYASLDRSSKDQDLRPIMDDSAEVLGILDTDTPMLEVTEQRDESPLTAPEIPTAKVAITASMGALGPIELHTVVADARTGSSNLSANSAQTDTVLAHLQKEVKLLSLLPTLDALTFKKLHHQEPGCLPLRLLIGSFKPSSPSHLRGHAVWVSFKLHDKDGRAAPRMHCHAFHIENDELIDDNLKFKDELRNFNLHPAFGGIQDVGKKGDMEVKALVKYYYILAANARLNGFKEHLMPVNGTFVDQLKALSSRLQKRDGADVDSRPRIDRRRIGRLRKSESRQPSVSDTEDGTPSTRIRPIRRSSQRPKILLDSQPKDFEESPASDYESIPPQLLPRRLAMGRAFRNADDTGNQFLDPDADPLSSDGESGDEIPASIPAPVEFLLNKRDDTALGIFVNKDMLKSLKDKKSFIHHGMGGLKGQLNRTQDRGRVERELLFRQQRIWGYQKQIDIREDAVRGLKELKKELDVEANNLDRKWVDTWEAMRRG